MRIVVVGTGTGIGKTHLGVALVAAAARRGTACGLKPVESGVPCGEGARGGGDPDASAGGAGGLLGEDAAALAEVSSYRMVEPPPYTFVDAVSPHLAARRAGVAIDLGRVRRWVDSCQAEWVLVETAGALLSPLGPGVTNLDLALALSPDCWVLVGVDRLGVLHEVTACMQILRARGWMPNVVVLSAPEVADASSGTNAEELQTLGIASEVVTLPRAPALSEACLSAAEEVLHRVGLPAPKGA